VLAKLRVLTLYVSWNMQANSHVRIVPLASPEKQP